MSKRAAKKKAQAMHVKFIELHGDEIVMDERWHGRKASGSARTVKAAEKPGEEMSDEQLEADIRVRGLIEPLRVRQLSDGGWGCVAGARRLVACRKIGGLWPCTYNERERDDFVAATTTLAENTHRRPMRNYEIANFLWTMHAARPELTPHELADSVGMKPSLCKELLLVRSRASPELWALFERHDGALPAGIHWYEFVNICKLPKAEQVPAWLKLVDKQLAGKSRPTRAQGRKYRPSRSKVDGWLAELGENPRGAYLRGLRRGLQIAQGKQSFQLSE